MVKAVAEDVAHIEKLADRDNFQIWKFQISILLRASELFEIIETDTEENQRNNSWKKKNA